MICVKVQPFLLPTKSILKYFLVVSNKIVNFTLNKYYERDY